MTGLKLLCSGLLPWFLFASASADDSVSNSGLVQQFSKLIPSDVIRDVETFEANGFQVTSSTASELNAEFEPSGSEKELLRVESDGMLEEPLNNYGRARRVFAGGSGTVWASAVWSFQISESKRGGGSAKTRPVGFRRKSRISRVAPLGRSYGYCHSCRTTRPAALPTETRTEHSFSEAPKRLVREKQNTNKRGWHYGATSSVRLATAARE